MPSGDVTPTLGVGEQLKLLEEVIQKLIFKDLVTTPPPQCNKTSEIKTHLEELEKFFKSNKIFNADTKVPILFNTITEDMRLEISCQVDFDANETNYDWIKSKLVDLFHPKESEITPLVKLYSIKQKPHQTLREFLSEIRIEGYKLLKGIDAKQREKRLVDAFCKGLRNDEVRIALSAQDIDNLDDAYKLIKKEKSTSDECYTRQMNACDDNQTSNEIQDLKKEMGIIQRQLQSIVTILQGIKSLQPTGTYADVVRKHGQEETTQAKGQSGRPMIPRRQYPSKQPPPNELRRSVVQCWTCGKDGHISRFCAMNRINYHCNNCGRQGHTTRSCRLQRRSLNVRHIQDQLESDDEYFNDHGHDSLLSSQDVPTQVEEEEIQRINVLTVVESPEHQENSNDWSIRGHRRRKAMKKRPSYPQYIQDLDEYIHGKRSRRNVRFEKPETVITRGHPEKAKNKPIVRGLCHGKPSKIFLDTGAEINVIDKSVVMELAKRKFIKINLASKVIRCANNSRLNVEGWVRMSVTVAGQQKECKFWVIDHLFPKIIVGIRAMKDLNITVDPGKDCIWVEDKNVPFLSHVETQSHYRRMSENGKVPGL
jgi:hypothetical protein